MEMAGLTDLAAVPALDTRLAATPSLVDRLQLIRGSVAGRIAFSTSLGLEDQAILHGFWQGKLTAGPSAIDVFTLDTGRLFPETLETLNASETRYRLAIRVLTPDADAAEALTARDGVLGFRRSVDARKACCDVRKVQPLARGLAGAAGWITGMRRGQSGGRAELPLAAWDAERQLIKFNPIADWSLAQLEAFIGSQLVPVNPLHAKGFPSIGCQTCTRAIAPGEDLRAGRWWWESEDKKECGLHFRRPVGADLTNPSTPSELHG